MPNLFVLAGPNGAGKTTAAPHLIGKRLSIAEFVNADAIASGLSGFAPESVAIEAGRIMLVRLRTLASEGRDFAFETTLASRSFAPWLAELRATRDYLVHIAYLWLPAAELAVRRVEARVRLGGHSVPRRDVERRYVRGLANFFGLYMPIADSWEMHDNSSPPARLIAGREGQGPIRFGDEALWEAIQDGMKAREQESRYGPAAELRLMGVPISEVIDIFTAAGREALARHKALGVAAVVWRDGRVVEIPPDQIQV